MDMAMPILLGLRPTRKGEVAHTVPGALYLLPSVGPMLAWPGVKPQAHGHGHALPLPLPKCRMLPVSVECCTVAVGVLSYGS